MIQGMKGLHLLALNAAFSALLILAATQQAGAQRAPAGGGPRNAIPSGGGQMGDVGHRDRGHKRVGDVFLIDQDVVEVVEVEKAAPAAAPAAPPAAEPATAPEKREPYKIGRSYASLPGGCMKMIEDGASYYFCGGEEWYQLVGGKYKAVDQP